MKDIYPYILSLVFGGFGYLFVYYFWEPKHQMDNLKREITIALTKYAGIRQRSKMKRSRDYDGPGKLYEEELLNQNQVEQTILRLKQLAGELRSVINTKKTYPLLSFLHLVPQSSEVEVAANCLVGWSNSFGQEDQSRLIEDFINKLVKTLKIPIS